MRTWGFACALGAHASRTDRVLRLVGILTGTVGDAFARVDLAVSTIGAQNTIASINCTEKEDMGVVQIGANTYSRCMCGSFNCCTCVRRAHVTA